jgi:hypothetical protein
MLATNIPNSAPVEFTRSMLYHPEYTQMTGSGTYPYITDEVEYSNTNIGALTYPEIVDTFFNKDKFINMVSAVRSKSDNKVKPDKQKTLEHNVMTMMLLLFPTKYFTVNNHKQSIELLEPGIATHYKRSIFYNPLKTMSSYVKINSKPYTVTEMIWLNDILNHPTYRKLLEEVYNFNRTLNTYKSEKLVTIDRVKDNMIKEIDAIETEITNGIKIGLQGKANVTNKPYASGSNYNALFIILFLKKIISNEKANDELKKTINDEIKTTADKKYAGFNSKPDNYIPAAITDLYTKLASIDKDPPDEYERLKIILEKINGAMNSIDNQPSKLFGAAHVENQYTLKSHIDKLFNRNLIKEGIDSINQYLSAVNINLSKQSSERNDNQIINQFKFGVQYLYLRPILTTTNTDLQYYIDAKRPEIAREWINRFENIYKKYVLKVKDENMDRTDEEINRKLLNLNVNNINMEKPGILAPTKEIYIKMTLIDGEVNDANKSDIYCPITNDMLGNELLHLIEHRSDNANIMKDEVSMFSVNAKKTAINYNNKARNTPANANNQQYNNKQYNLVNLNNQPENNKLNANKQPEITRGAREIFGTNIFNKSNNREFGKIINDIQRFSRDIEFQPDSILNFITNKYADNQNKDQYDESIKLPDLPSAINEWSNNPINRNNNRLIDKFTLMKTALATNYEIIDSKLNGKTQVVDGAYRVTLSNQLAIIKLYSYIVELLLANETAKNFVQTSKGGKLHKKRRHKTIKCKSKPLRKTYKRRNF